jgi:hypothetical protein
MDECVHDELAELRRVVAAQQEQLDRQAELLRDLVAPGPQRESSHAPATRRHVLRLGAAGIAGAIASAALRGAPVAAVTGEPLIAGQTEDAQTPTQLQYTGPSLAAGGAFVAGAGVPPVGAAPAGVLGYVTGSGAEWGVHGASTNAAGGGVLGTAAGPGAGVTGRSTSGPDLVAGGTGFLRLASAGHTTPSIPPQAGDLFRMDADELFYTVSSGPPVRVINLVGNVGGLVFLDAPVRAVDTRLGGGAKLQPGATRTFSLQTSTTGEQAVPEGSRAAMITVTVDATEGAGGFLTIWAADQTRPFISSVNWFAPGQIIANTTTTRVVRPTGGINVFAGVNRTHMIIDVIAYYH